MAPRSSARENCASKYQRAGQRADATSVRAAPVADALAAHLDASAVVVVVAAAALKVASDEATISAAARAVSKAQTAALAVDHVETLDRMARAIAAVVAVVSAVAIAAAVSAVVVVVAAAASIEMAADPGSDRVVLAHAFKAL